MATNTSTIVIVGNLVRDVRSFGEDASSAVTRFRLAVNGRLKKDGAWASHASFYEVVVFGREAERCAKSLAKGSRVCVSGEVMILDPHTGADGKTYQDVEVRARSVEFLSPKKNGDGADEGECWEEDLPF